MQQLPEALAPLAAYRQFTLWKTAYRGGKLTKIPIDHRTGAASLNDKSAWISAPEAIAAAASRRCGVAFIFTSDDPFFFLDIDGCLQPDGQTWTSVALALLARFPGAAVEVSQSGRGLHVFGTTKPLIHGCTNTPLGLELYTSGRFVALTGTNAIGSAGVDQTANLTAVAAEYFPATAAAAGTVEWTSEPDASWAGPADDGELIKRAKRSKKSAASIFGGKCSFADLWDADLEALVRSYPSASGLQEYGYSEADAALAQHLAFWTGGDCERIYRLMWGSGLVREKWTAHGSYLRLTIENAVGKQTGYYVEQARRKRVEAAAPVMENDGPTKVIGYQYLGSDQQIGHFAGCVYVQNAHRIFTPTGALLKPDQFNATYGGYEFQRDEGGKTTRKAWEAFTESQVVRYPKVESVCFRPALEAGAIIDDGGTRCVNTYVPVETKRVKGDPAPFLGLLEKLFPEENDRQIILAYMAACIQHKGVKFQWCPLIQGVPGNGKSFLSACVAFAVGKRYRHLPQAADIDNKFNIWLTGNLFIGVEDIYVPEKKREIIEVLKPMITGAEQGMQGKGDNQITADNCANFILNSNWKNAVQKTKDDRRFAIFYTPQQSLDDLKACGMWGDYFPDLYDWAREQDGYAIVNEFLSTYEIPDKLNPAGRCHRAPWTTSTNAAIYESLGSVEQEILESIDEGKVGFAGGWVSSMAVERLLLDRFRSTRIIPRNRRRELLQGLGYDYHPALPGGRVKTFLADEQGKPRLFVRHDHPALTLTDPGEVVVAYLAAQAGEEKPLTRAPVPPYNPGSS